LEHLHPCISGAWCPLHPDFQSLDQFVSHSTGLGACQPVLKPVNPSALEVSPYAGVCCHIRWIA